MKRLAVLDVAVGVTHAGHHGLALPVEAPARRLAPVAFHDLRRDGDEVDQVVATREGALPGEHAGRRREQVADDGELQLVVDVRRDQRVAHLLELRQKLRRVDVDFDTLEERVVGVAEHVDLGLAVLVGREGPARRQAASHGFGLVERVELELTIGASLLEQHLAVHHGHPIVRVVRVGAEARGDAVRDGTPRGQCLPKLGRVGVDVSEFGRGCQAHRLCLLDVGWVV